MVSILGWYGQLQADGELTDVAYRINLYVGDVLLNASPYSDSFLKLPYGSRFILSGSVAVAQVRPTPSSAGTYATSTGDITNTSPTDVLVDGMTLTPVAGTYAVWFTGSIDHSAANASTTLSVYFGGAQDTNSIRKITRGSQGSITTPFTCVSRVTVNGAQAIEGRWSTSTPTVTMHQTSLYISQV